MDIQNKAYSEQSPDGPSRPEVGNRELHRITSTAIIRKDGKYLIVRRSLSKKVWPGKWTVPGGGLEVDDYINTPSFENQWYNALEISLKREIQEEVGLETDNFKYLTNLTFIRPDNIPVITFSFYCDWRSGEVKLNEESVDYKWISADEAKISDLIPGIDDEIIEVDKILNEKGREQKI